MSQGIAGTQPTLVAGVISDVPVMDNVPGDTLSLSLTADGRLRVSSLPAVTMHDFWAPLLRNDADFGVGPDFRRDLPALHAF